MEQIKVEFNSNGKKKGAKDIIIPPEKAALKILIDIVVTIVGAAILYYFMLPPMNFQAYEFYMYIGIVAAIFIGCAVLTSGAFRKPEYVPYVKKVSIAPAIIIGILVVAVAVGYLISCPFFRAKSYSKILSLETAEFSDTISSIDSVSDFDKVPMIDSAAAEALADKTLGEFATLGLESQFELNTADSTQINYKGSPYRVYPLVYGDIFKWFTNSVIGDNEGIPGYVIVNLNTQEAQLVTNYDIKYSTAEHFNERLERVIRFRHPTAILGEISFEVDDTGKPYWVVEIIEKKVGVFGGDDVKAIVTVDAVTGEETEYSTEDLRSDTSDIAWVDQAYDANLLVEQYNYLGKYTDGFWNSIIGQSGVKQASDGYSFLAVGDDVYLYTGVTSVTSDDSILGFFFINQRTKEAFFYNISGATESAAQLSAQGKVSDKGWSASFPILLNIDGQATYFMALKDDSSIVKSYAMVNVAQYNVVAVPTSEDTDLTGCVSSYINGLASLTPPIAIDFTYDASASDTGEDETGDDGALVTGTVTDIRTECISGTTYYYFELDGNGIYYYVAAKLGSNTILIKVGDAADIYSTVTPDAATGEVIIPATKVAPHTVTE